MNLDDLTRLVDVREPQLSPDGLRVAVVLETVDEAANQLRRKLVVFDVERPSRQRTIATGTGKLGAPRWSPDGSRIAYLTDRGTKDGKAQLEVRQVGTGRGAGRGATRLTAVPTGVASPAWAPDGHSLAFVAAGAERAGDDVPAIETDPRKRVVRVRGHRHRMEGAGYHSIGDPWPHVWVVPAGGGEARQVTEGPYDDADPVWSPDGAGIAFLSDRSKERDRHFGGEAVHVVEVATGKTRRLTPEGLTASLPSWSPDGKRIAYLRAESPNRVDGHHHRLWVVTVSTGKDACWSASVDRSVGIRPGDYQTPSRPAWAPDGKSILHLLADAGTTQLVRFHADAIEWCTGESHIVEEVSADAALTRAIVLRTDAVTPSDLWLWTGEPGPIRRLVGWNDDWLIGQDVVASTRVSVERSDGFRIEGWLTAPEAPSKGPKARSKTPVIVVVHGGPHNAFGERFAADIQLWASAGYAVLAVNPRGSGSYEESFARAVIGDWGGADYEDILAVLDEALATRGDLDPKRVAITGGSYGGFMSCWAITQTDRFVLAVAGAPITNLESEYGTADIGPSWFEDEHQGTPWSARDRFVARSAVQFVERVRTPLFLYHGEADLRCPIEQSEQFFTALVTLGREVEFMRVPNEGHVLPSDASPVHRRIVREAILEQLERYLGPRG